jgi:hypothetical protein
MAAARALERIGDNTALAVPRLMNHPYSSRFVLRRLHDMVSQNLIAGMLATAARRPIEIARHSSEPRQEQRL